MQLCQMISYSPSEGCIQSTSIVRTLWHQILSRHVSASLSKPVLIKRFCLNTQWRCGTSSAALLSSSAALFIVCCSASFLAELSVSSPQKLFIFIIYKNIFWIKVSKKYFIQFSERKHCLTARLSSCKWYLSLLVFVVLMVPYLRIVK